MIIIDSGLGGLSVARALPQRSGIVYIADTAGFPYGAREAQWLVARSKALVAALSARHADTTYILACNTLSVLALAALREAFAFSFVGTVPAVKVAAEQSRSRRFTLLATPNTAKGAYVNDLIDQFAKDCAVECYGAPKLAEYAEALMLGHSVSDAAIAEQIAPCFHDDARGKTDTVILGCTHFPLIQERLRNAAPWQVAWIDPAAAIARRALSFEPLSDVPAIAYVTSGQAKERYAPVLAREGFHHVSVLDL
jgi:glutamate racemase